MGDVPDETDLSLLVAIVAVTGAVASGSNPTALLSLYIVFIGLHWLGTRY